MIDGEMMRFEGNLRCVCAGDNIESRLEETCRRVKADPRVASCDHNDRILGLKERKWDQFR